MFVKVCGSGVGRGISGNKSVRLAIPARVVIGTLGITPFILNLTCSGITAWTKNISKIRSSVLTCTLRFIELSNLTNTALAC